MNLPLAQFTEFVKVGRKESAHATIENSFIFPQMYDILHLRNESYRNAIPEERYRNEICINQLNLIASFLSAGHGKVANKQGIVIGPE